MGPLKDVLLHAYGRAGRRRRQLLTKFLRSMGPSAAKTNSTLWEKLLEVRQDHKLESLHPAFAALLQDQARNHPLDAERPPIRNLKPGIPEENIWGRPVPLKAERGMRRRFWAHTLDKVFPPLPESEWNRLRDLVTGVLPFEKPPQRRSKIHQDEPPTLDLAHVKEPIAHTYRSKLTNARQEQLGHEITPRFMRRLWASVWNQCPRILQDEATGKWAVTWGSSRSAASLGVFSEISDSEKELLEGMEQLGPLSDSFSGARKKGEGSVVAVKGKRNIRIQRVKLKHVVQHGIEQLE